MVAPRRPRHSDGWGETYGALDLGTNNCRLLVACANGAGFRVIDAFSRIVRLGEASTRAASSPRPRCSAPSTRSRSVPARSSIAASPAPVTLPRGVPPCRKFATIFSIACVKLPASLSRRSPPLRRRALRSMAALPCSTRPCPMPSSSISAALDRAVWLRLQAEAGPRARDTRIVSLPFGVVTFTECYGGDVISAADYEAMIGEAQAAMVPFARQHRIAETVAGGGVQMLGSSGR